MSSTTSAPGGVDPKAFRQALGRFATGVAIVTTRAQGPNAGQVAGITINSFTSVSLTPPIILWCLGNEATRYPIFAAAESFGVSILAADQRGLSDRFAKSPAPFADDTEWEPSAQGVPVMRGALAQLSCRLVDARPLGDHLVIAGQVEGLSLRDGAPLAYFSGKYAAVGPAQG